MSILKEIDWQMISFAGLSLVNEYLNSIYYPKIYYWKIDLSKDDNNNNKAA